MSAETMPTCPYKGLQPYTEADRAWFFGRERDVQIVISNLYAAPLTILYGASGVGKSSVLLAGVVPEMRATPRTAVVVFRNWQDENFAVSLKRTVLQEVARATGRDVTIDLALPLDEFLGQCTRGLRENVFFIFDQFEEYFLYTPASAAETGFDAQFARAVNRRDVRANFLLSMREDGLSRLDRFQGRIANLLGNMLRLDHLDRRSAADAIRKPLDVYNQRLAPGGAPVSIEDGLVEVLLDQVRTGRVVLDPGGQGQAAGAAADKAESFRIETPFLQLVLTRLWDEERAGGANRLQLATLTRLGGTENIARTHLDKEMEHLAAGERAAAARMFRFLVTPSGSKIAQDPASLAAWAELPEAEARPVLAKLASEMRILRHLSAPGQPDRFEIFHDMLAPAILDWRRRFAEQQAQEEIRREEQLRWAQEHEEAERKQERERARWLRRSVAGLVVLVVALAYALYQQRGWTFADRERLRAQRDLDSAYRNLKAAQDLQLQIRQAGELIREGQLDIQARNYDSAIAKLDRAIAIDDRNPNALMMKGYAQMRKGETKLAVQTLENAVRVDPNYPWSHYNLALAYWAEGQQQKAVEEVKRTIDIDAAFRTRFKTDGQFRNFKAVPEYRTMIEP